MDNNDKVKSVPRPPKPIDPIEAARNAAIKRWNKTFEQAGLGGYAIDFSDVEPDLIEHIGKSIGEFFATKG